MGLQHFPGSSIEPVYVKLTEADFFLIKEKRNLTLLKEQLTKIEGNRMTFNLNWDCKNKTIYPLGIINSIMVNKSPLLVSISFHDVKGIVMYVSRLEGFKFTKIINDLDYDWENLYGIKNLIVEFDYKEKIITTF